MATTAIITGAQFDALPYEEGRLWELVDGELIPMSSPTPEHQIIVQRIMFALMKYLDLFPLRGLAMADVEFALDQDYRVRPDVLFLQPERSASLDMKTIPVPGAPDIAVEVISPSERASDAQRKVDAYLRYGTREVWQVYPSSKAVMIHRGPNSTTLTCGETITTPVLPDFSLPVQSLFLITRP